jgi:hypothetical protein
LVERKWNLWDCSQSLGGVGVLVKSRPYSLSSSRIGKIFFLSVITVGCTHTNIIDKSTPSDELEKMNRVFSGKRIEIELLSSEKISAEEVHVDSHSVHLRDMETDTAASIALTDIHKITFQSRSQGALEGLGIGFLTWAGLVGTSVLVIGGNFEPADDGPPAKILVYWAFMAGAPIPILGAWIGAGKGSKYTYIFNNKE